MQWIIATLVIVMMLVTTTLALYTWARPLRVKARAALLVDQTTGEELYSKNPEKRVYPASTTKLMTALVAMDYGDLDEPVQVGSEITLVSTNSSLAGLEQGETLTLRDLLFALMLPSGCDAAYTIAAHIGRRYAKDMNLSPKTAIYAFVRLMNRKAQSMGARSTWFVSPDGYHHPGHFTTTQELLLIARSYWSNSFLRMVAASDCYMIPGTYGSSRKVWENSNMLLRPGQPEYYPTATGLKTGTTAQAGACLVATAMRNGRHLMCIVMGSSMERRFSDVHKLLDYGFYSLGEQIPSTEPLRGARQIA